LVAGSVPRRSSTEEESPGCGAEYANRKNAADLDDLERNFATMTALRASDLTPDAIYGGGRVG
jgi:hypothetical protein